MLTDIAVMAFEWSCVAVTLCLVVFRLSIRFHYRRLSYSDLFVLLAWLVFLNTACMDTGLFAVGLLGEYVGKPSIEDPKDLILVNKLLFAENTTYQLCMYFVKASMLCFYAEFVQRHLIFKTWIVLCITGFLVAVGALWSPLFHLLWCRPISDNWNPNGSLCSIIDTRWIIYTNMILHVGTEVLLLLIPLLVLHSLRALPLKQKIGAGIMFALGLLSIVGAVGTFYAFYIDAWTGVQSLRAWMYVTVEEATSVTIACLPAFRLLWIRQDRNGSTSDMYGSSKGLVGSELDRSRLVSSSHSKLKNFHSSPKLEVDSPVYLHPLRDEGRLVFGRDDV